MGKVKRFSRKDNEYLINKVSIPNGKGKEIVSLRTLKIMFSTVSIPNGKGKVKKKVSKLDGKLVVSIPNGKGKVEDLVP